MNYKELKKLFSDHESRHPQSHLTGYITFSSFGSAQKRDYPWEGRTYVISSDNKAFQPNMGGYSIFGSCLDGTEHGVRLENYMAEECGGPNGWVVEDCCIVGHLLIECSDLSISEPKLFCTLSDAQEYMLRRLADKGELDYEQLKKSFADTKDLFEDGLYGTHDHSAWFADRDEDWHWEIKTVLIFGPLNMVPCHE